MKNRKKYWKKSVIWGKTLPTKEYNVETQKEEIVEYNCPVCKEWNFTNHFFPVGKRDWEKPRRGCRECYQTKVLNEDGKLVVASGAKKYDLAVNEKNQNPIARNRDD